MKKVIYLFLVSFSLTSCTIEDVMNYLNGQTNSLTEEQKQQVESSRSNSEAATAASTTIIPNPDDPDNDSESEGNRGGGRP